MTQDVVCGMPVNEEQAAFTSEYEGQIYYFCSERCKLQFDQDPQLYANSETRPA